MKLSRVLPFLVLLNGNVALAQQGVVDSLVNILGTLKDEKQKTTLLHRIVSSTWDFSFERAREFAHLELELANKIGDEEALTVAYTDLGMYYYFTGDYPEANKLYKNALRAANGKDFGEFPAYTMTRIGNLHRVQGEYDSALKYYSVTEKLLNGKPPGIALGSVYFHHGWLLKDLSKFNQALHYLYQASSIRKAIGDSLLIAECWRVISDVHIGLTNLDSAQFYLDKVLGIAKRFGDSELVILTSINLGDYYLLRGEDVAAIQSYETALDSLAKHDFKRYRALALMQIGRVFDTRGDYLKAMDYYFESLKLHEELNSRHAVAQTFGYMGWLHTNLKNFDLAEENARHCLSMMNRMNDLAGEAFALNLLGYIDFNQKDYNNAIAHYNSALKLRQQLGLDFMASNTKFNIARAYERQGRLDDALRYYMDDMEVTADLRNKSIQALSYNNIGWIYARKGDFKESEKYLTEGQRLSLEFGTLSNVRDNYYNFARMFSLAGQVKKSNAYYEKYITINDSLLIQQNAATAQQRDAIYQLEKKNREIVLLNERNQLRGQEIEAGKKQILFQNLILLVSLLALLLLSVVIYVLYRYNRSNARVNKELNKLNRSISEQKEEIQSQAEELQEANQTILEVNKTLEGKVKERTSQLNQAFMELDTFIYRSSHDLRRPLTTFMGLAEVARISVKDNTAIELFDKVSDTARNLDRMLAKLQAVSQIASTELSQRKIFLEVELDYALDQYRQTILEQRIRIERRVKYCQPILSYASLIRIILENLIENALTFHMPRDAFVLIEVEKVGANLQITVEDNGEGIAPEFQNRIFEMYFRANERSKGNGLGLYLVKRATEKLNGKIDYIPKTSGGSIFLVTIPVVEG